MQRETPTDDKLDGLYTATIEPTGDEKAAAAAAMPERDGVFGDLDDQAKEYRALTAWGAFMIMTKANLGVGVLAIPGVFHSVGLVPGYVLIVGLCAMMTFAVSYIGPFKRRHPECYSVADALYLVWGPIGRDIMAFQFCIGKISAIASFLVSIATCLNAITLHGACTAIFIAVAAVTGFLLSSIRTLHKVSWLAWVGVVSIVVGLLVVTVAVGVQDRPAAAPPTGPWNKDLRIFANPSFTQAISSITTIIFSYSATPTFFSVLCEMKEPRKYQRVMLSSMALMCAIYLVIGTLFYYYCGQYVSSPSLGSAGPLMKRISYGLVLPALLVSLCIWTHIIAKFLFVRILFGTYDLTHPTKKHYIVWLGINFVSTLLGYIFASAIPIFGVIVSFIGAICSTPGTLLPFPIMWWHDEWRRKSWAERKPKVASALAYATMVLFACTIIVSGTYSSVKQIISAKATNGPWTCADNSNSVKK
ncbi:hypothetical protein Q8F55_000080 [Vanrija albida]|uniref:Amino acid transporter transmembrane domain-containing protein n=1 Tax=Vanrija albida TaxID=181172 RepID=A0ABR3QD94_9TREE